MLVVLSVPMSLIPPPCVLAGTETLPYNTGVSRWGHLCLKVLKLLILSHCARHVREILASAARVSQRSPSDFRALVSLGRTNHAA